VEKVEASECNCDGPPAFTYACNCEVFALQKQCPHSVGSEDIDGKISCGKKMEAMPRSKSGASTFASVASHIYCFTHLIVCVPVVQPAGQRMQLQHCSDNLRTSSMVTRVTNQACLVEVQRGITSASAAQMIPLAL
jgi:hypothetical protein